MKGAKFTLDSIVIPLEETPFTWFLLFKILDL